MAAFNESVRAKAKRLAFSYYEYDLDQTVSNL